jgi:hypothetical protein
MNIVIYLRVLEGNPLDFTTKTRLEHEVEIMGQDDEEVRNQIVNDFFENKKRKFTEEFFIWHRKKEKLSSYVISIFFWWINFKGFEFIYKDDVETRQEAKLKGLSL